MADQTYTSTTAMPAWAQPYAQGLLGRAQQVADTPYQQYTGETVAGLNPWQTQAYSAQAQRAMQGSGVMNAANQTLTNTLNGSKLSGNPYLQQNIDAAQGDVVRQWNNVAKPAWDASMQHSGSFGNSGVASAQATAQEGLQRQLGNISSTMRMSDYNTERGYQNSALGLAPGYAANDYADISKMLEAGKAYQTQDQAGLDAGYKQFLEARNYPTQQLGTLGTALGQAVGNNSTSTQTQPGASTAATAIGGALTGAQLWNLLFSGG